MPLPIGEWDARQAEGENDVRQTTEDNNDWSQVQFSLVMKLSFELLSERMAFDRHGSSALRRSNNQEGCRNDLYAKWNNVMHQDGDTRVLSDDWCGLDNTQGLPTGILQRDVEEQFMDMHNRNDEQSDETDEQG